MSSTQDISMDAGQFTSSEAQAAVAANNLDMEIENLSPAKYDPESPLTDYNEDDPSSKKEHQRQRSRVSR